MFDELGQMMAPSQPAMAQPQPELKGQWDGWIQNPANQAALLNFGLGLMVPQWGGASQQFANAAAGAAQGASATQGAIDEEAQRQEALATRGRERGEDRALKHEEIASRKREASEERKLRNAEASIARFDGMEARAATALGKLNERAELGFELTPEEKQRADSLRADMERYRRQKERAMGMLGDAGPMPIATGETSANPALSPSGGNPSAGGKSAASGASSTKAEGAQSGGLSGFLSGVFGSTSNPAQAKAFIAQVGAEKAQQYLQSPAFDDFAKKNKFNRRDLESELRKVAKPKTPVETGAAFKVK